MNKPYKSIPIIVPTLNRYEHFINCVESLSKNTFAPFTDIYISVDYPPSDKYIEGNQKIKDYLLKGVKGFRNCYVYIQEKNLGAKNNSEFLIDKVKHICDSYIYTEDDNVFSPLFLKYVAESLYKYENDPDVVAICGHSIPINWKSSSNIVFFDTEFNAWGYASWNSKKEKMMHFILNGGIDKALKNPINGIRVLLKDRWTFCAMSSALAGEFQVLRKNSCFNTIDISYSLYMILCKKKYVMPVQTMVHNMGYDGSGVNCGVANFNYYNQPELYDELDFSIEGDEPVIHRENYKYLNIQRKVPIKNIIKAIIYYINYCIFGDNIQILKFFKRIKKFF